MARAMWTGTMKSQAQQQRCPPPWVDQDRNDIEGMFSQENPMNDSDGPDASATGSRGDPVVVEFGPGQKEAWLYVERGDHVHVSTPFTINRVAAQPIEYDLLQQADKGALMVVSGLPNWCPVKVHGFRDAVTLWCRRRTVERPLEPAPALENHIGGWKMIRGGPPSLIPVGSFEQDEVATRGLHLLETSIEVSPEDGSLLTIMTTPRGKRGAAHHGLAGKVSVVRAPSLGAEVAFPAAGAVAVGLEDGVPFAAVRSFQGEAGSTVVRTVEGLLRGLDGADYIGQDSRTALFDFAGDLAQDEEPLRFLRAIILRSVSSPVIRHRVMESAKAERPAEALANVLMEAPDTDEKFGDVLCENLEEASRETARRLFVELSTKINTGNVIAGNIMAAGNIVAGNNIHAGNAGTDGNKNSSISSFRQAVTNVFKGPSAETSPSLGICLPPHMTTSARPPFSQDSSSTVIQHSEPPRSITAAVAAAQDGVRFSTDDVDYVKSIMLGNGIIE
jgi:hypothetical protein